MRHSLASFALGLCLLSSASCSPAAPPRAQAPLGLAPLFERLRTTDNPAEAQALESAIRHLWAKAGPQAANALMAHAMDAAHHGQTSTALALLDRVFDLAPTFPEGWAMRASLHFMTDNPAAALADLAHTLALEPRHFAALTSLGYILLELNEPRAALGAFEASLAVNPHQRDLIDQVGRLRRQVTGRAI
jgi:tetratricopeptide (TPR) repeat protein